MSSLCRLCSSTGAGSNCAEDWRFHRCCSWTSWSSCPLLCKTGGLVQTEQKSVEFAQLQFLDKVVGSPVVVQDRCFGSDSTEICGDSAVAVPGQGYGRARLCACRTDSAEYCGFSTGACTGQVMDMPVRVHVGPDSAGCRRHLARGAEAVYAHADTAYGQGLRLSLRGPGSHADTAYEQGLRLSLRGPGAHADTAYGQGLRLSLRGPCAHSDTSVVLVLMRIRLMGKDCACLSVVLVLVCSVLDMLYGYGDVYKVCAFVLRGQGC